MKIVCIIPARFSSQRLPGKPLLKIDGVPMIEWVYRRARQVESFLSVVVATDDKKILNHIKSIGGDAIMTPKKLRSGTDRVAFVARDMDTDIVVNLQGDEPLINPDVLEKVCQPFNQTEVVMTTPVTKIKSYEDLINQNLVRVVVDKNEDAIFFSRAVIPYYRDNDNLDSWFKDQIYYKHVGIYAYRKNFLKQFTEWPMGKIEKIEKLEQLRVLENGYKIRTVFTDYQSRNVDTDADLEEINFFVKDNKIAVENFNG